MRTTSFRPLIATAMAVLAFSSAGMGAATTYVVPAASDTTQVALDQSGNERSAVPTEDGLKLNTAAGDSVDIANNVATWRDQAGNSIASIDLDNEGNENVAFRYDEDVRCRDGAPRWCHGSRIGLQHHLGSPSVSLRRHLSAASPRPSWEFSPVQPAMLQEAQ